MPLLQPNIDPGAATVAYSFHASGGWRLYWLGHGGRVRLFQQLPGRTLHRGVLPRVQGRLLTEMTYLMLGEPWLPTFHRTRGCTIS